MFVNVHQVELTAITMFILHNQTQKDCTNCDVLFVNFIRHVAICLMKFAIGE